jgi:hypothetical protein
MWHVVIVWMELNRTYKEELAGGSDNSGAKTRRGTVVPCPYVFTETGLMTGDQI